MRIATDNIVRKVEKEMDSPTRTLKFICTACTSKLHSDPNPCILTITVSNSTGVEHPYNCPIGIVEPEWKEFEGEV